MKKFIQIGLLAAGILTFGPLLAPAPVEAASMPVGAEAVRAAAPEAATEARYKRRYHRHRRSAWRGHRGSRFVIGGPNPSGCYYNEGGGRYVSCSAGGFR
jgi:hypothetical protein